MVKFSPCADKTRVPNVYSKVQFRRQTFSWAEPNTLNWVHEKFGIWGPVQTSNLPFAAGT